MRRRRLTRRDQRALEWYDGAVAYYGGPLRLLALSVWKRAATRPRDPGQAPNYLVCGSAPHHEP